ncbi:MAG: carboxylate-amine ligase, partial [Acidimicrobiia bacterium]
LRECQELLQGQVSPEFLRSQIEVGTRVSADIDAARRDLVRLRRTVADVADRYGAAIIASSTHPFAEWRQQLPTPKDRYLMLAEDLQVVARRLVICGMHVHVGIDDRDLRIDLMNQATYFLPHLLALSTSSPFWHGVKTGLKSYRTSVFKSMPRTGLPGEFSSWSEYQRHVEVLVRAGIIEDASKLWWDIRPSANYPTLEMRVSDICTRLEDAMCVAAIYLSVLHMLYRRRLDNQRWRQYAPMLVSENVWRAQRYGTSESLMDFGKGELVPFADLVDEIIDLVRPDAEALGCPAEVEHARAIVAQGTSADRQLTAYAKAMAEGSEEQAALEAVVDHLIEDTLHGI